MQYTGNELFDTGLAGLTVLAEVESPADLTRSALEKVAARLADIYRQPRMQKSTVTVFTTNGAYTQASFAKYPEKKEAYINIIFTPPSNDELLSEHCYFTGLPALNRQLSVANNVKIEPGRATRQHFPMLAREGSINYGHRDGYPISWEALLVAHALPLSSAWLNGKWLSVYSVDNRVIRHAAAKFIAANLANLAREYTEKEDEGSTGFKGKLPPTMGNTRLGELMLDLLEETGSALRACHWSNSGQGPGAAALTTSARLIRLIVQNREAGLDAAWQMMIAPDNPNYQEFLRRTLLDLRDGSDDGVEALSRRIHALAKYTLDSNFSYLHQLLLEDDKVQGPKVSTEKIRALAEGYMEYLLAFQNTSDFKRYVLAPPSTLKSAYVFREMMTTADKKWQTSHPEGLKTSFIGDIDVEATFADYFNLAKRHFQTMAIGCVTNDPQRFAIFVDVINESRQKKNGGEEIDEPEE